MSWTVILPKSVQKQLDRLPLPMADRLLAQLEQLELNPRPSAAKKLKGHPAWRVRVGDHRVLYQIDNATHQIVIVTIGHRRDVYR